MAHLEGRQGWFLKTVYSSSLRSALPPTQNSHSEVILKSTSGYESSDLGVGPSEWLLRKYPGWRDDFCPKVVVGTCEPAQCCMIQWEREIFTLENSEHLRKKEHLRWPQNKTKQKLVWTIREYGRSFWGATVFHVYLVGDRLVQCVKSIELYACDLYTFPNIFMCIKKLKIVSKQ